MRRCTRREARHARGATNPGSNTVTLGCGVTVTAPTLAVHCDGMDDGSCRYADQSGVGTADPMQMSCASAFDRPGAASAALYSPVGVRLRKSPAPPRTMVRAGPSEPETIHVNPTRGETCSSVGMQSVRSPNSESTVGLWAGAPLNRAGST